MFEQFLKLPPLQKAGILVAILVLLSVGGYIMIVEPELAVLEQNQQKLKQLSDKVQKMRTEATESKLMTLKKRRDEVVERDKENRKMLPTSAEVPDFIESVQHDAVNAGLRVTRFDRLKTQTRDLVNVVPVKMTVQGKMLNLIAFLRVYAGNRRRTINLSELALEVIVPQVSSLRAEHDANKPLDSGETVEKKMSVQELLLERIELEDLSRKKAVVRATFIAYAFTWTGKPAPPSTEATGEKLKKKRT
jgi:Tfp pilus assembly protein PilO